MQAARRARPGVIVTVLLAVVAAAAASSRAAEVRPPERLAHFDMMPKVATLPDGTMAAYFIEVRGPGLAPTPPVQDLKCRISKDSGRTWGELHSLFTFPSEEGGFGFHAVLVDDAGEVHFMLMNDANTGMLRAREPKPGRPAVEPRDKQRLDIWHIRSTGGRTKWSKPKRIWTGRVSDLQSAIQLRGGRIVLPFGDTVKSRSWKDRGEGFAAFTYFGEFDTRSMYSDDGGETWQTSKSILRVPTPNNFGDYGAIEPVITQLSDGRVWMLIRTQTGRLWQSFSRDGGEWSPPAPTGFLSSDSPAAFARLDDKRLVMLWNNCQRYPYAQGGRHVLHAAISDDDGQTWRGRREVLRDPDRLEPAPETGDFGVAYPYPVVAPDGRVVYTMWVQSGIGRSIEAFDPEWLLQTSQRDDFAGGLDGWSVFGTKGVEIASHAGASDGHVLAVQKTAADWPAAAVWNFPFSGSGRLRMRVLATKAFAGATVLLTDHFSVPFDAEDEFFSLFRLPLTTAAASPPTAVAIEPERWIDLEMRWDAARRTCEVAIDDKVVTTLRQQRASDGPSYLRVRSDATEPETGRLLIDSVEMAATPQ
jgi:hypothetical protein